MIYVKLTGGLGNQMFQYAAAKWVQEITKQKICLDYSDFKDYKNNHNATFENTLKKLKISYDEVILTKQEFLNETGEFGRQYYKKYKMLSYVSKIALFEGRIYIERKKQNAWNKKGYIFARDAYIPIFPENICTDNIAMSGFFQSVKYFPEMRQKLTLEFRMLGELNQNNRRWFEKLTNSNSVCLHIRRGDYTQKGREHCTIDYYKSAIDEIKKRVSEPVFYVFSDDIGWVKKNLIVRNASMQYVNENNDCITELELMKHCQNFIISNSTFSWWAQYLSENDKKVVIAPRPWLRRIPTDIYMENWVTLPVYK